MIESADNLRMMFSTVDSAHHSYPHPRRVPVTGEIEAEPIKEPVPGAVVPESGDRSVACCGVIDWGINGDIERVVDWTGDPLLHL